MLYKTTFFFDPKAVMRDMLSFTKVLELWVEATLLPTFRAFASAENATEPPSSRAHSGRPQQRLHGVRVSLYY